MAGNLGYSKLTYSDIVNQITTRINNDPQFQTFRETAVAKQMLELFAGMTDMINYYIERRAEESYLETAKLKSSVIQLSKQLGYVVQRPIPAHASISMTLLGDDIAWSGVNEGDSIQLPIYSSFTYGGNNFILKNVYTYTFTADDIANLVDPVYTKTIQYGLFNNERNYFLYKDEDLVDESDLITMDIIQGEKKYYFIEGVNNEQIGQNFQTYNIPDTTFSNIYGNIDYDLPLTKVAISDVAYNVFDPANNYTQSTSGMEFTIDRRSLLQTGQTIQVGASAVKVCLMRTNMDESMDLVFGDNIYSEIGAELGGKDNISIQYISTLGAKGNLVGVVGEKIIYNGTILTAIAGKDITSQIEFALTTDIIGGADMEETASIQLNAPAIYYSLDRCVTPGDYTAYLKSLTSPIIVKNAIACGEQDESENNTPIEKLFNVALFSCFGELYRYNSVKDEWSVKDSDTGEGGDMADAVLDAVDLFGASPGGSAIPDNHYFYVVVAPDSPGNTRNIENAALALPTSKLGIVYTNLKTRSQMTVKNVYISPMIQEFSLQGTIFVNKMIDADVLKTKIKNDIYSFLNNKADFNTPVYISNLIDIIEDNDGILYSNVQLVPTEISGRALLGVAGQSIYDAVLNDSSIAQWLDSIAPPHNTFFYALSAAIASTVSIVWFTYFIDPVLDNVKNKNMDLTYFGRYYKYEMTESWFWKQFIKSLYNYLSSSIYLGFVNTMFWDQLIMKIKNTFSYPIRYNLMTENNSGVITKKDDILYYTLKTEIPMVTFDAGVMYK